MKMQKTLAALLALTMVSGLASCGESSGTVGSSTAESAASESSAAESSEESNEESSEGSAEESSEESAAESAEESSETENAEPLNTNVVHAEFKNTVLNLKANFDIANLDGFETKESTQTEDQYRANGSYAYPDPDYFAPAMSVQYDLYLMSAHLKQELEEASGAYSNYEKADFGSAYDTYLMKQDAGSGKSRYTMIFIGGDYLDGSYIMKVQVMPQLDSATQENVDLIAETFARSLKLESDDSVLKTADGFSLAEYGVTCANKVTVAGEEVEMQQKIYQNSNAISADVTFIADGIGYNFYTYSFDDISKFGVMGGGEYQDVTFAGKPGKIKVEGGIGTIKVYADIQIDDKTVIHAAMETDSALQQGALSDAAKLAEKLKEMLNDENKAATVELMTGYVNDIFSGFSFS